VCAIILPVLGFITIDPLIFIAPCRVVYSSWRDRAAAIRSLEKLNLKSSALDPAFALIKVGTQPGGGGGCSGTRDISSP